MADDIEGDEESTCRICHMESTPESPLFYPCKCSGSMKYIHQQCMLEWLRVSSRRNCEVCGYPIKLKPVYKENMPAEISIFETFMFMFRSACAVFKNFLSYSVLLTAWAIISPYFTFRITKLLYIYTIGNESYPRQQNSIDKLFDPVEIFYGVFNVGLLLLIAYGLYFLSDKLSQFYEPWWIRNSSLEERSGQTSGLIFINIFPRFLRFIFNLGFIDLPFQNEPTNITPATVIGNGETIGIADINEFRDNRANADQNNLNRVNSYYHYIEHMFYVGVIALLICISVSSGTYIFFGIPLLRYNFIAHYIAKESLGLILTNIFFYYSLISLMLYGLHVLFRRRSCYTFGNAYIFMKIILIIFIEYFCIPEVVGFAIIHSIRFVLMGNSFDAFAVFPLGNIKLASCHAVGFVAIFWIMNILFLIYKKLRPGVFWFLQDPTESSFNPIYDMIYDDIFCWQVRMVLSTIFCTSIIALTVLTPLFIIQKFFTHISSHFGLLPIYMMNLDFYIMVQFTPVLLSQIGFKEVFDFVSSNWIGFLSYIFDLESYLLGTIPLQDGTLVWNREGSYIYSSLDPEPPTYTVRFQSYYKSNHFNFKVSMALFLTFFTLIFATSLIGCVFLILSFFFSSLLFGSRLDSLTLNLFCGMHYFFIIYVGIYYLTFAVVKLQDDFIRQLVKGLKSFILLVSFYFVIPILTGTALNNITVPFKADIFQTPVINPLHGWYIGFLLVKMAIFYLEFFSPLSFLRALNLMEFQVGFRTMSFEILFHKIAVPYVRNILLFLSIPYVFVHGILKLFGVSEKNLCIADQYSFLFFFNLISVYYIFELAKYAVTKIRNRVKDQIYLVGHILQNIEDVAPQQNNDGRSTQQSSLNLLNHEHVD